MIIGAVPDGNCHLYWSVNRVSTAATSSPCDLSLFTAFSEAMVFGATLSSGTEHAYSKRNTQKSLCEGIPGLLMVIKLEV